MSESSKSSPLARLRNYFLTGVIVCAPLAITLWLTWAIISWADSWVKPYIPETWLPETYLPFSIPGFGLIVALVLITLAGFVTASFLGRRIVHLWEEIVNRMPFIRTVYNGLKQILETVLSEKSNTFKKVGLVEYPRKGLWALVFVATEAGGEVQSRLLPGAGPTVAVFLPTTPNPTSGFLLYVPKADLIELDMSVEEGAKLVISAGLVSPEYQQKTAELARKAQAASPPRLPEPAAE